MLVTTGRPKSVSMVSMMSSTFRPVQLMKMQSEWERSSSLTFWYTKLGWMSAMDFSV